MVFYPLLDRVLVIALQEQRPYQDGEVVANLERHIEHYRSCICRITRDLDQEEILPGVRLYQHTSCLLWGEYDYATFYLGDDLESVASISMGCDAIAQEFLFGSPYVIESEKDCLSSIGHLFEVDETRPRPLVAITRLKLGDHLTATGVELRRAVAMSAYAIAGQNDVEAILLRCWSWPELIVVLLSDKPGNLVKTIQQVDQLNLKALCDQHQPLATAIGEALRHRAAYWAWRLWIDGNQGDRRPEKLENQERLAQELKKRHAVVGTRTQLGVLRAGWPSENTPDPQNLLEAVAHAFTPHRLNEVEEAENFNPKIVTRDLVHRRRNELRHLRTQTELFHASIVLQAKPGHSEFVLFFAKLISNALNQPLREVRGDPERHDLAYDLESEGAEERTREAARLASLEQDALLSAFEVGVRGGCVGQESSILMTIPVLPEVKGFLTLLCVTHSFRICSIVRPHLLMVTTHIAWPEQYIPVIHSETEIRRRLMRHHGNSLSKNGFGLVAGPAPVAAVEFERRVYKRYRIGRVEGRSLRAWFSSIANVTTRPEMLGSMIEVYRASNSIRSTLLGNELPGERPDEETRKSIATSALTAGSYLQRAYQQRLQFSPIMSGAPQINGQLPYGVHQIVSMLDGVSSVIMQSAFLNHRKVPEEWRANLVVFGAGSSLATARLLSLGVLKLNLLQAWTPLSLCLLFHELGHSMVHWHHWLDSRRIGPGYNESWEGWRQSCVDANFIAMVYLAECLEGNPVAESGRLFRGWFQRPMAFLEDVFSHAVWRNVGCGNEWDLFVTQFLAGQGMGLRTSQASGYESSSSVLHDPSEALEAWAESVAHLIWQKALAASGDHVEKSFLILQDYLEDIGSGRNGVFEDIVDSVVPFAAGEINYAAACCSGSRLESEDVASALRACFLSIWCPILTSLCLDPKVSERRRWEAIIRMETGEDLEMLPLSDEDVGEISSANYKARLKEYFASLRALEEILSDEYDNLASNREFRSIRQEIPAGRSVVDGLPWEMLSSDGAVRPTAAAVLWVREILKSVTVHFRNSARAPAGSFSVPRDSEMRYDLAADADEGPRRGVFVDFLGGMFATGREERRDYLKVRLAAIESLSVVAQRMLAASISVRLERNRRYLRCTMVARVFTSMYVGGSRPIRVQVIDQSPIGVGLKVGERHVGTFAEILSSSHRPSTVVVQSVDIKRSEVVCRVVRVDGDNVGLEVFAEEGSEPQPLRTTRWVRTHKTRR